jgi:putative transposase
MLREKDSVTMVKTIDEAVLDELLKGCERPEDLMADGGLMKELRKALMQRMLGAELTEHLGYEHGEAAAPLQTNRRNGVSRKTLKSEDGAFEIEVPRDREGSFEPRLIGKGQTRIDGLDEKIIAMYARGMSVRDIRGHLEELYGLEVSPDLISRVTDAVLDEVKEWRSRALDAVYPVVIFDALRVKIRDKDSRIVKNKAVYLALGITGEGEREVLGLWIAENEGAKFWLSVMTELRNRGVQDILIAVVDGLKGFPEAITAAFPQTMVQTCVVHLVRHSLNFCSWKDRKAVAAKLREVYVAETAEAARDALEAFDVDWGRQYPSIAQAWRRAWQEVIPFFAFSPEIRRVIYTTNAIESLNRIIRKAIKTRGSFPSEDAAEKLIYLAIRGHEKTSRTVRGWLTAVNQFAIMFEDRFKPIQG